MTRVPETPTTADATPVVEYLVRARGTWGTRVYEDGAVEELTGEQLEWQPLVHIPPHEVASLIDYAVSEGFFDLPPTLASEVEADESATVEWTLERHGGRHTVVAAGTQSQPLLLALNDRLQLAVGRALNNQADSAASDT